MWPNPLRFTRIGPRLAGTGTHDPLPAPNRPIAVTGANRGLGLAMVHQLSSAGIAVIAVCRNRERASRALHGLPRVHWMIADLSNLDEVRKLAEDLPPLHGLIHNAGALHDAAARSPQGEELTAACHLLGPHLLTRRLFGRLERVVYVSSGGMYLVPLALEELQQPATPFDGVRQYAIAKRAQALLPSLYHEHLGTGTRVEVMHPGWADTPGVRSSLPRFWRWTRRWLRTPEEGAETASWLATAPLPDWQECIWLDRRPQSIAPFPGTRTSPAQRQALWNWLEATIEPWMDAPLSSE